MQSATTACQGSARPASSTTESLTSPPVIKLIFPEGVPSIVVPRECSLTELIDAAVARMGRYMQDVKMPRMRNPRSSPSSEEAKLRAGRPWRISSSVPARQLRRSSPHASSVSDLEQWPMS